MDQRHVIGSLPDWGRELGQRWVEKIRDSRPVFPCPFAISSLRRGDLRFAFVDSTVRTEAWSALPEYLASYVDCAPGLGQETAMVVFFRPDEIAEHGGPRSADFYFNQFWRVLSSLADDDTDPWPEDVPSDPDDHLWTFCFGGVGFFVVCAHPAHVHRKSRWAESLMLTFQPRWVFDGLEAGSPRGANARQVIRSRLDAYDDVGPSGLLGSYGDPANREWQQYVLPDLGDSKGPASCPFAASVRTPATGKRDS